MLNVVAQCIARLLTMREVSQSNLGILPLLHTCRECDWRQRWIWGIHWTQARKHLSEGSTLALKPRADVTRSSKQGYQWPHKKVDVKPSFLTVTCIASLERPGNSLTFSHSVSDFSYWTSMLHFALSEMSRMKSMFMFQWRNRPSS